MDFAELMRGAVSPEEFQAWRRRAFPFFEKKICLTHASVSPLPQVVSQAIVDYAQRIARDGQFDYITDATYARTKECVARLIGSGARAQEVAFAGSTSHAIGMVATSIDWQPGDNCVVAEGDFPANVVTWKNLQHTHGVEVRFIPYRRGMDLSLEDVQPLVDDKTRIVSLSTANYLSGCPIDTSAIGRWLHERNVLFCVDAIQTLGAVHLDAEHVDFVCADAHKWLLGPNGIAILWAREAVLHKLRPAILGWLAVQNRDNWLDYDTTPIASGERFEPGARNYLGIVALDAALELLETTGSDAVHQRVTHLRDYAAARLAERGCSVLWQPTAERPSGIVSFQPPVGETSRVYRELDKQFALSLRDDPEGNAWIRVSAHFMNCEDDIERLVAAIPQQ